MIQVHLLTGVLLALGVLIGATEEDVYAAVGLPDTDDARELVLI